MADALDDPALDLARGAERIDDAPDVVDRRDALHLHLAGLDVDRDLDDVDAEGEDAHPGRVRATGALAQDLRLVEHADDLLERRREVAVRRDDHAVADVEHALLEVVALRRDLDHLPLRVGRGRPHGRSHRRQGRGARRDRGVRPARRVAEDDLDVLEWQPELLGGNLRHCVPVPMSCIAVITVARPSEPRRTQAYEGGPPPPYQIWLAMPTPRFHVASDRA